MFLWNSLEFLFQSILDLKLAESKDAGFTDIKDLLLHTLFFFSTLVGGYSMDKKWHNLDPDLNPQAGTQTHSLLIRITHLVSGSL